MIKSDTVEVKAAVTKHWIWIIRVAAFRNYFYEGADA